MSNDYQIETSAIAGGILVEKLDQADLEADRGNRLREVATNNKRLMADAFMTVRKEAGMNRKDFSEWLGIPYRTMQDWERGVSQVPEYVLRLIAYKVMMEKERGNL